MSSSGDCVTSRLQSCSFLVNSGVQIPSRPLQIYISFDLENCNQNIFDIKLSPFRKDKMFKVNGKEKNIWSWYHAYNKIKHDRVKYYKYANLECLINALAALFLLNILYLDKVFYSKEVYDTEYVINKIEI